VTAEGAPRDVLSKSGKPLDRICREDTPVLSETEDKPFAGTTSGPRELGRADAAHDKAPYYQP
jgi:hypothetical protein